MLTCESLTSVFQSSREINIGDSSKLILMSDVHRGTNSKSDRFSKNKEIYFKVLYHYYNDNFTYIELGDGDELWEYKDLRMITKSNSGIFNLLNKFYKSNRLYFIYGNHDIEKRKYKYNNYYYSCDKNEKEFGKIFGKIKCHEGLILSYYDLGKIFLTHGHQVDFFNCNIWRFARFLVRYFWHIVELYLGIKDKTSPAKNINKKNVIDHKIRRWSKDNNQMIITGHTHRANFPKIDEAPYFNTGSCVYPGEIIGIEIENGEITLVKWSQKELNPNKVKRDILSGPEKLQYFLDNK
ncbi:metallophosphoesterase family protein [Mycoplasmatota bacterium WC44]